MQSILKHNSTGIGLAAIATVAGMTFQAASSVIDFDSQGLTGPSVFASASPSPQHLDIAIDGGNVAFDGGVILKNTTNLPADQTAVYGTATYGSNLSNPLTIKFTFSSPIQNFFMNLYNGETFDVTYKVSDNSGHSANFTLVPNLTSGQSLVGFAALGTEVDVTAVTPSSPFDFFVDNIHFNEALPNGLPDGGATSGLFALGLFGLGFFGKKRA